ncbi:aspartate:alanine exchanger family transporter [Corynebacterium pygosceleis]|uniref:Aspartate:alanine exchanger family transporter n=1 Tax=Corynebacterium pygosceleis TaxID=2800406 RepID=A0A9Q4C5E1_9CORY|nr:aspartate:alanine exchanger family transporter [Corynebacterium pygosceleis]MCK7636598.1 transporter [Corynebacterium pygosceleis]MCK7675172.1 transporter [Corynebacterium pygosceleis]MCL0120613.1 transporter [Corynebacterium pygosceleis]MCX7467351.1 aspartate:alanine exchanger family transporter [Corynebacterium pygosceleis]
MQLLVDNQLLALLVIMSIGLVLGRLRIGGFSLGVAAVLFVGIGFSTAEPGIQLPPIVFIIGLSLFVYTIGLEAGPGFFRSMRTTGVRHNLLGVGAILLVSLIALVTVPLLGIGGASGAGMFTGAMTNTPAMAAVVDAIPGMISDPARLVEVVELPVVAYSLAYPIGVLGVILSVAILGKVWKVDHDAEARKAGVAPQKLITRRVRVERDDLPEVTNLRNRLHLQIIVSRIEHNGKLFLPEPGDTAGPGDILSIVGTTEEIERAASEIGELLPGDPTHDERLDYRRIFVSTSSMVGIPLSKLNPRMPGMLVTRVRRGDVDMVATPDTVLQLGDRVRVVSTHDRIDQATRLFGDSYKRLSDINLLPLLAGMAIGVLIGMIPLPLPGGITLRLGSAGGPLVVALILGALGRTGRIVWQVPYGANLALRQFGITLFLAGIGTTAGAGFKEALGDPATLKIIAGGAVLTFALSLFTLFIGHRVMRIPFGQTAGIVAGLQTHPAVLSYVSDQTRNELPSMGYTTVYPMAMVVKIIAAQAVLFILL